MAKNLPVTSVLTWFLKNFAKIAIKRFFERIFQNVPKVTNKDVQMHPNTSEQVPAGTNNSENFQKLAKKTINVETIAKCCRKGLLLTFLRLSREHRCLASAQCCKNWASYTY